MERQKLWILVSYYKKLKALNHLLAGSLTTKYQDLVLHAIATMYHQLIRDSESGIYKLKV